MNDTQQSPPPGQPGPPPPAYDHPAPASRHDLRQLRRSASDRRIAGVCGGLGRHFDVDPTLFRVLLAVLVLFGGTGVFLYAALWLLLPDERTGRAVIGTGEDLLRWLLIGAGIVAVLMLLGGIGGLGFGMAPGPMMDGYGLMGLVRLVVFALVVAALVAGVILLVRSAGRRSDAPAHQVGDDEAAAPASGSYAAPAYATAPAHAPRATAPPMPARPRRTGPVLFWPTMAVLAIVVGAMAWADVSGSDFAPGAYGAAALVVIGLALVVGAFVGRPGGLIAAGLIATVATAVGTVAGDTTRMGDGTPSAATLVPASATQIPEDVRFGNGTRSIDLGRIEPRDLDGREISVSGYSGQITVTVPDGVRVDVDAEVDAFGSIRAGDFTTGGVNPTYEATLGRGDSTTPTIELDLDLRFGEIVVVTPEESLS